MNNEIFTAPAEIIITADATDADGSVNSVEFFEEVIRWELIRTVAMVGV
ncbi:hypothetical protein G3I01_06635 [Gramella sp. MT6]|nr:Ig-like domain-containing protein [Gramella sp. MT6]QYA25199.1 hypothetical protein G3I01_06635 [Gramella sp. MT6]